MYTKDFQINLLAHIVLNEELFKKAYYGMRISDMDLPACQFVLAAMYHFYDKYKFIPNLITLQDHLDYLLSHPGIISVHLKKEEYESLAYVFQRILELSNIKKLDVDYYLARMADYVKTIRLSRLQEKFPTASGMVQPDFFINEVTKINREIQVFDRANTGIDGMLTNSEPPSAETLLKPIPTTITKLNYYLVGGLRVSMLGLITACPGVGKTTTLINFMNTAVATGNRSLFITLELVGVRIKHRYQGIAAGIDAQLFKMPFNSWPPEAQQRYQNLVSSENKFIDYPSIVDLSYCTPTLTQIEDVIGTWIEQNKQKYGENHNCNAVFLDWLDLIDSRGAVSITKDSQSYERLTALIYGLSQIARKYKVALWTATQGNRSADGVEVIQMKHNAGAFGKSNGLDVGIGLSEKNIRQDDGNLILTEDSDFAPPCDRELIVSIYKNRDSTRNIRFEIYQGPTLKFYNNRSEAYADSLLNQPKPITQFIPKNTQTISPSPVYEHGIS